jgi:hypothetical protein
MSQLPSANGSSSSSSSLGAVRKQQQQQGQTEVELVVTANGQSKVCCGCIAVVAEQTRASLHAVRPRHAGTTHLLCLHLHCDRSGNCPCLCLMRAGAASSSHGQRTAKLCRPQQQRHWDGPQQQRHRLCSCF